MQIKYKKKSAKWVTQRGGGGDSEFNYKNPNKLKFLIKL